MSTAPVDTPAQQGRSPRFWWVLGSILVAASVALVVWFGLSGTKGAVTATDVAFTREPREVTMVFDVDRPVGTVVTCHVKALDSDYATVGSTDVEIPASQERSTRESVVVRTTTQAVTATVDGCRPL
ncbi:DUF4307 domain-containing protein [Janibacter melonis]|uniref:DUF4307 domain-containing protein n=1 Tax=Janibacter melonis TaxID=262209 RepID=UPI002044C8E4|nr:DUF4307 domain-containing protein [Janibacter melonis]MCM3554373.1 DUF4307 domain-containing protein [Janibacter melonis]